MSLILYPYIQKQIARDANNKEIKRSNTTLRAFNYLLWNMPESRTKDRFIKICQEEERTADLA